MERSLLCSTKASESHQVTAEKHTSLHFLQDVSVHHSAIMTETS